MSQSKPTSSRILAAATVVGACIFVWAVQAVIGRLDRLIAQRELPQKTTANASIASDWVNLNLRLTHDRIDGPPAEGFAVEFPEFLVAPGVPLKKVAGSTGIVELGLVHPARHSLTVRSPWNAACDVVFDVRAGLATQTEVLVCPSAAPPDGTVAINIDLPDDLELSKIGVVCSIYSDDVKLHEGAWADENTGAPSDVFVRGDGMIFSCEKNATGERTLAPIKGDLHCRGETLRCSVDSVHILNPTTANDQGMLLAHLTGLGVETVPKSVQNNPGVPNQFKITLSAEALGTVRKALSDQASVDRILK
jgi:hypothetical protein